MGNLGAALVLVNIAGFYDRLSAHLEQIIALEFAAPDHRALYHLEQDPIAALDYIERYESCEVATKWF